MNPLSAGASACGRAVRPWLWRTLLPAAVLDPSGQASSAERQPGRTAGARFTAGRVRDHTRPGGQRGAGAETGNTATTLGKGRWSGRASGRQYLRSATCATQSKAPAPFDEDRANLDMRP